MKKLLKRILRKAKRVLFGKKNKSGKPSAAKNPENKEQTNQKPVRNKWVASAAAASGLSYEQMRPKMLAAKRIGIPLKDYAEHHCWDLTQEELNQFAQELAERQKANEKDGIGSADKEPVRNKWVASAAAASGLSYEQMRPKMLAAKRIGIPLKVYAEYHCWDLTQEELGEFAQVLADRRRINEEDFRFYIDVLNYKYGWDEERARKELQRAKDNRISYEKYMKKAGWDYSDEELAIIRRSEIFDKRRHRKRKEAYLAEICKNTGWSRGKAELEINRSKNLTGASYEDYLVFRFHEIPLEEQKKYVTLDLFNKMRIKYNERKTSRRIFDCKEEFNRVFDEQIHRKWFTNKNLTYEAFLEHIQGLDHIIAKLMNATQGVGVYKFAVNHSDEENRAVYDELMKLKESIIEEYIVQHDEVMKFCSSSVNTLRLTTIYHEGECKILFGLFRMGRGSEGAIVDNFHAGGIAAYVDPETGVVCTDAMNMEGGIYPVHPDSGVPIRGFVIPNWNQMKEICEQLVTKVPGVNLVGWDFAITQDGFELIEGNPGAYIVAQMMYVPQRVGLRSVFVDPYL